MWTDLPDGGCFARMGDLVLQVSPGSHNGWAWVVARDRVGHRSSMRGLPGSAVLQKGWNVHRMDAQLSATKVAEHLLTQGVGAGGGR